MLHQRSNGELQLLVRARARLLEQMAQVHRAQRAAERGDGWLSLPSVVTSGAKLRTPLRVVYVTPSLVLPPPRSAPMTNTRLCCVSVARQRSGSVTTVKCCCSTVKESVRMPAASASASRSAAMVWNDGTGSTSRICFSTVLQMRHSCSWNLLLPACHTLWFNQIDHSTRTELVQSLQRNACFLLHIIPLRHIQAKAARTRMQPARASSSVRMELTADPCRRMREQGRVMQAEERQQAQRLQLQTMAE
jgi:hypothetical protein